MNRIKELRIKLGIKQQDLAIILNLQRGYYCNMENGRLIPANLEEILSRANSVLLSMLELKINDTKKELQNLLDFKNEHKTISS